MTLKIQTQKGTNMFTLTHPICHMTTMLLTICRGIKQGVSSILLRGEGLYVDLTPNICRAHAVP
jgi:hypothetical protein